MDVHEQGMWTFGWFVLSSCSPGNFIVNKLLHVNLKCEDLKKKIFNCESLNAPDWLAQVNQLSVELNFQKVSIFYLQLQLNLELRLLNWTGKVM